MPAIYDLAFSGLVALALFAVGRFLWRRATNSANKDS